MYLGNLVTERNQTKNLNHPMGKSFQSVLGRQNPFQIKEPLNFKQSCKMKSRLWEVCRRWHMTAFFSVLHTLQEGNAKTLKQKLFL